MKTYRIAFLITFVLSFCPYIEAEPEGMNDQLPIKVNVGDMEFTYGFPDGMQLSVFNIPIITCSDSCAVSPGWSKVFYVASREKTNANKSFEIKPFGKKGKQVIIYHRNSKEKKSPFVGKEIFTLLPDNSITIQYDLQFNSDEPAVFQWQVARIVPMAFIAKSFRAELENGKTVSGIIPFEAQNSDFDKSIFAKNFLTITIQTKFGSMQIDADPKDGICISDYRKNRWGYSKPSFWFGCLERKISRGKESIKTTLRFSRKATENSCAPEIKLTPRMIPVDDAQRPYWGNDFIIPTPKNVHYTKNRFPLNAETKIYLGRNPSKEMLNAVSFFTIEFSKNFNLDIPVIHEDAQPGAANAIIVGAKDGYEQAGRNCKAAGVSVPKHKEGYSVLVNNKQANVAANNAKGVFYGITTLVQLAKLSGKDLYLQGAEISDYPTLEMRAVHFIPGRDTRQFKKALHTLIARFKINTLFWECEYTKWDSAPEIHHEKYSLDKKDARELLQIIPRYFMDVIPLVSSLGHVKWIFHNGQNLELAEDPETPYAYCPTNPDSYKFLFKICQEVLDLFGKPEYFHIGHDEVILTGRFPYKSRFTGKTATELMVDDIKKIHQWFAERDIKIMIWGDMFLTTDVASSSAYGENPRQATKGRQALPKDIVICDWHYSPAKPDEFISLKAFHEVGLKTIGCGWDNPENIRNFNKACADFGSLGYMQTTWAGYEFDIDGKRKEWPQFWAYILAAEHSWNGGQTPEAELPFNAPMVFIDLWNEVKPSLDYNKGYLFDLSKIYNCSLADNAEFTGWLGYGPDMDLSAFPLEWKFFGKTRFEVGTNSKGYSAVLLASSMNPEGNYPQAVQLETKDFSASEINLLLTATFKTQRGKKIGQIQINYSDRTQAVIELKYGINIFAFDDMGIDDNLRIAWHGSTRGGKPVFVNQMILKTDPAKKIASIRITSNNTETAPVIIAITAMNNSRSSASTTSIPPTMQ